MNKKILGYSLAFIAIIFLSFHSVSIRYLVSEKEVSSTLLVFFRYFLGTLFLTLVGSLFLEYKDFKRIISKKDTIFREKFFWLSSLSLVGTLLLFHISLKFTTASDSMLIQTLSPIIVVIGTFILTIKRGGKTENFRKILFSIIFASVGSSLLINDTSFTSDLHFREKIFGDFIVFLSAFTYALFNISNYELRKKYSDYNGLLITIMVLSVGVIITLPFFLFNINSLFPLTNIKLGLIFLIGFGSTGIAFLCWFLAARYLNAIILALLANIVGVTTIIVEYFVYNSTNPITLNLILGALLILGTSSYVGYLTLNKDHKK